MSIILFTWLIQSALASTVILLFGLIAARLCRQPADGVRIAQWTLATTLAALVLACWPALSIVSLGLVDAGRGAASPRAVALGAARALPGLTESSIPDLRIAADIAAVEIEESSERVTRRTPAATRSGVAETPRNRAQRAIGAVSILYLSGCGAMLLSWMAGLIKLHRLRRRARPAPPSVHRMFAQITKMQNSGVRLLVSDELPAPIMWGVRRPVIILPRACCVDPDPARLRYCLAHEWSHVVRRDFATWQLATALQMVLFYHPLLWRVRRQLAVSMDQLADATASGHGDSATDYAEYLLELARRRLAPAPAASLGMSDTGSRLRERIVMLLESGLKLRDHCSRRRSLAIATTAIVVAAAAAGVRVDAYQPETPEEPAVAQAKAPPEVKAKPAESSDVSSKNADGSITYFGVVTDKVSGRPISGVKVSVIRRNSREGWQIIETTEHLTNLLGVYSFTIPPEQAAESALYIEVDAHHPDYAAKGRSGYSHAMILKNIEMGELPFYTRIGLWPGEAITGTVVSPEGEPLEDVDIRMYSASDKAEGFTRGSFDKTTTDADGRFRMVPPTPGDGVL